MREEVAQTSVSMKRTTAFILIAIIMLLVITVGNLQQDTDAATGDHTISVSVTNGTGNSTTCADGGTAEIVITSNSGFVVPSYGSNIKVEGTYGSYDLVRSSSRLTITIENVTGYVSVNVTCVKPVTVTLESDPDVTRTLQNAIPGTDYSFKLSTITGYNYPDFVTVYVGSSSLHNDLYEYDKKTGNITIDGDSFKSGQSIRILATYEPLTYTAIWHITGGTYSSNNTPTYGESFVFYIYPDKGHDYPDPVTVKMGNKTVEATHTGSGRYSVKIEGAPTITASCEASTYTITYRVHGTGEVLNMGPNVPKEFTYGIGAKLPSDVSRPNYIFKFWTDENGKEITEIPADTAKNVIVYGHFVDDLSVYDNDGTKLLYYIVAVVSILSIFGVAYISRK